MPPPPPPPEPPPPPAYLTPPPGYVAYGGYGAVQGTFSRLATLTKWLVALLGIALVVQAISLLAQLSLRSSAGNYLDGTITSGSFDNKLGLYVVVALVAAGVGLAQLVVLIVWTFKMANNLVVLGRQPQTFKAGLTIAVNIFSTCTLGIANFFMWRELWMGSDPDTAPGDPSWKRNAVAPIIVANLVLTLVSLAAGITVGLGGGLGGFRTSSANDIAKNLQDKFSLVAIAGVLQLALGVVFILLVRQLAARHMKATREV